MSLSVGRCIVCTNSYHISRTISPSASFLVYACIDRNVVRVVVVLKLVIYCTCNAVPNALLPATKHTTCNEQLNCNKTVVVGDNIRTGIDRRVSSQPNTIPHLVLHAFTVRWYRTYIHLPYLSYFKVYVCLTTTTGRMASTKYRRKILLTSHGFKSTVRVTQSSSPAIQRAVSPPRVQYLRLPNKCCVLF